MRVLRQTPRKTPPSTETDIDLEDLIMNNGIQRDSHFDSGRLAGRHAGTRTDTEKDGWALT